METGGIWQFLSQTEEVQEKRVSFFITENSKDKWKTDNTIKYNQGWAYSIEILIQSRMEKKRWKWCSMTRFVIFLFMALEEGHAPIITDKFSYHASMFKIHICAYQSEMWILG